MTSIFNQASFDFTNVRSRKLVFKIDQFLSGKFDRGQWTPCINFTSPVFLEK